MQVIGLCRFSYPAIGGFQVGHETVEERMAYLFDPERIEERFRLFETVALPCLRQQTDSDFTMVIVIGDLMPRNMMRRLSDLTADIPQIHIEAHPPKPHREVMKSILNRARTDLNTGCLQFRFDDDDAVSVDFVERLRETAGLCRGLLDQNRAVAIDFSKGYVAEIGQSPLWVTQVHRPYYTAALGMYVAGGCQQTIMNFAHQKIHHHMPSVTISDAPMWVRTHNRYNDSRQGKVKSIDLRPISDDLVADFEARFALDIPKIEATFAQPEIRA